MATGQYLAEVALRLAEEGHQVTVVTSRRAYDNSDIRFSQRETWRGVEIYRVGSTRFGKTAKWRRAADFASFIVCCCSRLVLLPRHDAVMALTTPPLISFIGAWLAYFWRARFFYWVMDFNPDEAIAAGWLRADSLVTRVLDRMSRFSLRRATNIIALDRFMRDRIVAKGVAAEKIVVLPPWSHDDEVHYDASGRDRFRQAHGLDGKFVVMYSGNHSPVHPLDTLLQAAARFRDDSSVMFCFVGGGSEFKRVQQWVKEEGLQNVLCLPYQPLDQLSASLSAADLHVVIMGEEFVGLVHPCKIYNIMGVAAPVLYIGPSPSHITEIFGSMGAGHSCRSAAHGVVDQVTEHIQEAMSNGTSVRRSVPPELTRQFAKETLLPRLVAVLTQK